jgi:hypothetical protein
MVPKLAATDSLATPGSGAIGKRPDPLTPSHLEAGKTPRFFRRGR